MSVYYNDNEPFVCAWMQNLMDAGLITQGVIDSRPIREVKADEVRHYTRAHWFAGIAGWDYALRLAGWPIERPVWTASLPCQPFSVAGKRQGERDDRHLWPVFYDLVRECRPVTIFGEQVEAAIRIGWLDRVFTDLEAEGCTCGAVVLGAHSVGAPHIRQRVYWVANAQNWRRSSDPTSSRTERRGQPNLAREVEGWRTPTDRDHHPSKPTKPDSQIQLAHQVAGYPTPRTGKTTNEDEESWRKRNDKGDVATPPLALVAGWATPKITDSHGDKPHGQGGQGLHTMSGWATPTGQDAENDAGPSQFRRNSKPLNVEAHGVVDATSSAPTEKRGSLNPAFALWLMGFPIAWANCGEQVTRLSRKSRRSS